jgi:hypothetical protein
MQNLIMLRSASRATLYGLKIKFGKRETSRRDFKMVARGKRLRATPGKIRIDFPSPSGAADIYFNSSTQIWKYLCASLQDAQLLADLPRGCDRRRSCHWLPSDCAFSALPELIFRIHQVCTPRTVPASFSKNANWKVYATHAIVFSA